MNLRKSKSLYLTYFLMIPFLHPRGFDEYFTFCSSFFKAWQYLALAIILVLIVTKHMNGWKVRKNAYVISMILYFVTMLFLTLSIRHTLSEAIQKIFVAPFVCLYTFLELKKNTRTFVTCVNNINLINLTLNITLFSPLLWKGFFAPISNHMTFLGHVQVCSQVGILSFLFNHLEYYLCAKKNKKKYVYQNIVLIISMITSFTSASYLAVALIGSFFLIERVRMRKFFTYSSGIILAAYLFLNLFFMYFVSNISIELKIGPLSMSGRGVIWVETVKLIAQRPICGYGVHGVMVKVFWHAWVNEGAGMNYMHNQLLQVLCDGGIVLLIPFFAMLVNSTKGIDRTMNSRLRFWAMLSLLVILVIMVFESTLEYVYVHIMFATFAQLPYIANTRIKRLHSLHSRRGKI